MPRAITLNVGQALRELGVTGGAQMELSDGPILPVVIMSDQTNKFVAERVEPRGVASTDFFNVAFPASPPEFVIQNAAPGGMIIESLAVSVPAESMLSPDVVPANAAFDETAIQLFKNPPNGKINVSNVTILTVGAVPATGARTRSGSSPAVPLEATWFGTPFSVSTPWYIAPGVQLAIRGNAELTGPFTPPLPRLVVSLTFREIPAIAGAPG